MLKIISKYTTPKERQKGLMFHKPLIGNEAVIFISPGPTSASFWNKNVSFPIDIAFFDKDKILTNIESLNRDQSLSVFSDKPWKYAVETKLNWFKDNNIKKGTHLDMLAPNF